MDRVASTMRAIEELGVGRFAPSAAMEAISAIAQAPPAPTWLFTLAAAAGAVALAVILGVQHLDAAALIFVSAAGVILRRRLAHDGANGPGYNAPDARCIRSVVAVESTGAARAAAWGSTTGRIMF